MKRYLWFEKIRSDRIVQEVLGCKGSCYWDLELSNSMKSESHHPFVPIHYALALLTRLFSVLGTIDDRVLYFAKTNC